MAGKLSLIDPVLSGNAAPLPGVIESFGGTDIYFSRRHALGNEGPLLAQTV